MRQPDFFVVGAAKSGTTALWKYFQQHPDIFVTKNIGQKELGYYSNQYGVTDKETYLNHFKEAKPEQLIGEVCHAYLTSEESAKWIKKEIPNAKIIMILRNPIERAHSLYNWMTMYGYENKPSFEKALNREERMLNENIIPKGLLHGFTKNYFYYSSGLYLNQVKSYLSEFGSENVLIIEYDDFQQDQEGKLNDIYMFLNISSLPFNYSKTVNKSKRVYSLKIQHLSRRILLSKYGRNTSIKKVFNYIMKINMHEVEPKRINNNTIQTLKEKYHADIKGLSDLCDQNFVSKWLN